MAKGKKRYTEAPAVPTPMLERYTVMLEVLAGRLTVSAAARALGMSRNHFQTLMHRGESAMLESITPKAGGRPGKAPQVATLEQENDRLKREIARLHEDLQTTDRMLQAASGLLQGRIRPTRQSRQRKTASSGDEDGEGEPRRASKLAEIERMRALGFSAAMAAAILGVHASTARRWKQQGQQCRLRRQPAPPVAIARAEEIVRRLHGQVGAEALRRSVEGLSRRQAACVKACTLTRMERSRKAGLTRVQVTSPGVIRGMDGLYMRSATGPMHALIAADASIPYRTSVKVGRHYDAELVMRTLEADIAAHGAPLVYRLDRARSHDVAAVHALLEHHGVLVLHGPPHCPRFYGQLERQNREHRACVDDLEFVDEEQVEDWLREALHDLNALWRRRALQWQTASEAWSRRGELHVDRAALRQEVQERTAHLRRRLKGRGLPADLAQRLAIEQALETRGYLRQTIGGWC